MDVAVLLEGDDLLLVVLEDEELVLVHLRDREDDQLRALHLQLQLVDVGVWSAAPTHVEAVVLLLHDHALAGQQVQRRVEDVEAVVAAAVVRHRHHEVLVRRHCPVKAVRGWLECPTLLVLVAQNRLQEALLFAARLWWMNFFFLVIFGITSSDDRGVVSVRVVDNIIWNVFDLYRLSVVLLALWLSFILLVTLVFCFRNWLIVLPKSVTLREGNLQSAVLANCINSTDADCDLENFVTGEGNFLGFIGLAVHLKEA